MGLGGVRNHMKNNERGLTLIEVLAATVILSIVLTAFITVLTTRWLPEALAIRKQKRCV
jgi:prepilin-type N-terminal cleavage/methylation domain-containing protein